MTSYAVVSLLLLLPLVIAIVVNAGSPDWRTHAERTDYRETSDYSETIAFCKRLDEASPWVKFTSFGLSAEGRALPLLIFSRDGAFTPEAARRSGKAVVLIQNGIHSGEIDGKEACLALAREMVVTKTLDGLLDHAIILVVPIYNVDGHEMASPYNRVNQDGPERMGWRATAQNLNLNRDYIKADAPETRAFLAMFNAWLPDLFVDNHVTDGADFQYDLLYTMESNGLVAPEVAEYVEKVFQPRVRPAFEAKGHLTRPYFVPVDPADPSQGIAGFIFAPRFSNGFGALRNRPMILVETHSLKSFKERTIATYDLMVETLREVNRDSEALRRAVRAADEAASRLGASFDPKRKLPLTFQIGSTSRPLLFKGKEYQIQKSSLSGGSVLVYGDGPRDIELPMYDELTATLSVAPPLGYVVPPAWIEVIKRLEVHGLRIERLAEPVTAEFETYRLEGGVWAPGPFEGRHRISFKTIPVVERRTLPVGSVVVRLDQPASKVAIHLLEPAAPDSLASWGFFDAIFEEKEYAEDYIIEKMGQKLLADDAALRAEFEAKIASDAAFAASPEARLRFLLERSPYADPIKGRYPVVRMVREVGLKLERR